MKKPPLVEAARAFRTIWSCHMPKGSASGRGSGIIMMAAMFGTLVVIAAV
jgi:hypothetical protein